MVPLMTWEHNKNTGVITTTPVSEDDVMNNVRCSGVSGLHVRHCTYAACTLILVLLAFRGTVTAQPCEPGAVLNGNEDPWSYQCYLNQSCEEQGNPCQADDVSLVGAYLADINGAPLGACQAGQPVQGYLWGLF